MTTDPTLQQMMETLAQKKAEAAAFEAKIQEARNERLRTLHELVGLPDTRTLISQLQALQQGGKKPAGGSPLSAEKKEKIRADILAEIPVIDIARKHGVHHRIVAAMQASMKKATS